MLNACSLYSFHGFIPVEIEFPSLMNGAYHNNIFVDNHINTDLGPLRVMDHGMYSNSLMVTFWIISTL